MDATATRQRCGVGNGGEMEKRMERFFSHFTGNTDGDFLGVRECRIASYY